MLGNALGHDDDASQNNESMVNNNLPPKQYEEIITKLESDIRAHIALEN